MIIIEFTVSADSNEGPMRVRGRSPDSCVYVKWVKTAMKMSEQRVS